MSVHQCQTRLDSDGCSILLQCDLSHQVWVHCRIFFSFFAGLATSSYSSLIFLKTSSLRLNFLNSLWAIWTWSVSSGYSFFSSWGLHFSFCEFDSWVTFSIPLTLLDEAVCTLSDLGFCLASNSSIIIFKFFYRAKIFFWGRFCYFTSVFLLPSGCF